ncbi:sigma-70 family RNA polymerase sigma factor [Spirillospora sp. NPDC048911]|uniref:sigma-70 family RNA polymerase sigma factor n=1 Tax=Spirillospora sp. NPDC048911 TaxID=3364527 RepID=UPI003714E13F
MSEQAVSGDVRADLDVQLEQYRRELTGYCYRMLGSAFEAEDAVQETMVRAWRSLDRFEGRSSLRSWLYRIATNVCMDLLAHRQRRARPMDLSPPLSGATDPGEPLEAGHWIEPMPDDRIASAGSLNGDPADTAVSRESVRLAFVAALQYLAPKQRTVLLLRELLGLSAREIAELLGGNSVASINSALQRARATMAARQQPVSPGQARPASGPVQSASRQARSAPGPAQSEALADDLQNALAERYADAFERFDMEALTLLLHVDATLSLPPHPVWLKGSDDIQAWLLGPGVGCRGSRLIRTMANGSPAFGQYRPSASGHGYEPFSLQVLEIASDRVVAINSFRDTDRLFPLFGLPSRVDA